MAHYVPIPKDLNDIKEKFIMGFTKRQVMEYDADSTNMELIDNIREMIAP